MRPGQYSRWVDPAPLEVERPRLPWWTMLPRKLLLAASPIILLAVMTTVVMFIARRVWRYPLFVIGATVLVVLDVGGNPRLRVRFVVATARWVDLPGNFGHRVVEP